MTQSPLRIAVAGLGTVGAGTVKLLRTHADMIALRCGRPIEVVAVSARDRMRDRGMDLAGLAWHENAVELADRADVDAIVEVIGGSEGPARELVERALRNGKHVVTANKALIAHHGLTLARLAEEKGVAFAFEAAVAGGIPIIRSLREGLAANRVTKLRGILNGTCNYILTTMRETGRDFADVLAEAQALGYAEADPSFDIDGVDTAHKLAILAAIAFGAPPAIDAVFVEGIRRIGAEDISAARELGYRIRLLGVAEETDGHVSLRVHPAMVPEGSSLGSVDGVFNAVVVEGDAVGRVVSEGRGAGEGPTASSVVADLLDVARGVRYHPFNVPVAALTERPLRSIHALTTPYYLRLQVADKPGVLAELTAIFAGESISLRSVFQRHDVHPAPQAVEIVVTTHPTEEAFMRRALDKIRALATVSAEPTLIRIEPL